MERKIGEVFEFAGATLEVVEQIGCIGCKFFGGDDDEMCLSGLCSKLYRPDGKSVIFKKVGESLELLIKAHEELVRCGIESGIVDEIEGYLQKIKITTL